MDKIEISKDVCGYAGRYTVSASGVVARLARKTRVATGWRSLPEKTMKPYYNKQTGYFQVRLTDANGAAKTLAVHALVCTAFHGPALGREVNHKNSMKTCNHESNLEWSTRLQNQRHALSAGVAVFGSRSPLAKLTEGHVAIARKAKGVRPCISVARELGVGRGCIYAIWSGASWKRSAA